MLLVFPIKKVGKKNLKELNGKKYILIAECDGINLKDYR